MIKLHVMLKYIFITHSHSLETNVPHSLSLSFYPVFPHPPDVPRTKSLPTTSGTDLFNPLAFSPAPSLRSISRRTRRPPSIARSVSPRLQRARGERSEQQSAGRTRNVRARAHAITCRPFANFLLLVASFTPIFRSSLAQFLSPFPLPFPRSTP